MAWTARIPQTKITRPFFDNQCLMNRTLAIAALLMLSLAPKSLPAAPPVFKCTSNGAVSYQNSPCPSGEVKAHPSIEQLNAERQKKLSQSGVKPARAAGLGAGSEVSPGAQTESAGSPAGTRPAAPAGASFKCDGRMHCSQMTSCAEAKYFLSHCPVVEMDGDRDGIPCEKQWCKRLSD
jgi:hypothetical protein